VAKESLSRYAVAIPGRATDRDPRRTAWDGGAAWSHADTWPPSVNSKLKRTCRHERWEPSQNSKTASRLRGPKAGTATNSPRLKSTGRFQSPSPSLPAPPWRKVQPSSVPATWPLAPINGSRRSDRLCSCRYETYGRSRLGRHAMLEAPVHRTSTYEVRISHASRGPEKRSCKRTGPHSRFCLRLTIHSHYCVPALDLQSLLRGLHKHCDFAKMAMPDRDQYGPERTATCPSASGVGVQSQLLGDSLP
jgi:hypothetical protein